MLTFYYETYAYNEKTNRLVLRFLKYFYHTKKIALTILNKLYLLVR